MNPMRDLLWHVIHSLPEGFWHGVTWLGDSGLLLPAAALIALWLASSERTRATAVLWCLVFGTASLAVLVSKLAFLGWGIGSARLNFTGISGHTMLSAAIWPVALWLAASRGPHRLRVALAVAGWVLAAAIGLSRLAIYAHSTSEVAAGYLLGVLTSASFLMLQRGLPHPVLRAPLVIVSLMLPMAILQPGDKAPTQGLLEVIAMRMSGADRPFTRADLHERPA